MRKSTVIIAIASTLLTAVAAGVGGAALAGELDGPVCPTEDSCHVDYARGTWHVTNDLTERTYAVGGCRTEDSCHADYRAGAWHFDHVTP